MDIILGLVARNLSLGFPSFMQAVSNLGRATLHCTIIVSEYDQEIPQSQTADKPMAPQGRATQQSRETRKTTLAQQTALGTKWLSGRVLDSRPKGRGFEPHRRHCVVVLEQDTFILA